LCRGTGRTTGCKAGPSAVTASVPELRVTAHSFSLHAAVRWRDDQRKEVEQLRYITRPAIAN